MKRLILILVLVVSSGWLVESIATWIERENCRTDTECEKAFGFSVEDSLK